MSKELPYSETYAVVSSNDYKYGFTYDTYNIETEIRNAAGGTFRTDYELQSSFRISSRFSTPYAGELKAFKHGAFSLHDLESATKVMRKAENKLIKMQEKFGNVTSVTENIIRYLQATGCKEVRIADPEATHFPGWDNINPLSVKTDLQEIRYALGRIENKARKLHPYEEGEKNA